MTIGVNKICLLSMAHLFTILELLSRNAQLDITPIVYNSCIVKKRTPISKPGAIKTMIHKDHSDLPSNVLQQKNMKKQGEILWFFLGVFFCFLPDTAILNLSTSFNIKDGVGW